MKRNRKILAILLFLIGCAGFAFALAAAPAGAQVLYTDLPHTEKPLRLHILANSDTSADQQMKLAVRDHIIGQLEDTLDAAEDKEAAMAAVQAALPELSAACNDFLSAANAGYTASLRLEVAEFPAIDYDGLIFAAGEYDALRIVLGEGAGHNWWCVLFPPLCFVDLASELDEDAVLAAASGSGETLAAYRLEWRLQSLFQR